MASNYPPSSNNYTHYSSSKCSQPPNLPTYPAYQVSCEHDMSQYVPLERYIGLENKLKVLEYQLANPEESLHFQTGDIVNRPEQNTTQLKEMLERANKRSNDFEMRVKNTQDEIVHLNEKLAHCQQASKSIDADAQEKLSYLEIENMNLHEEVINLKKLKDSTQLSEAELFQLREKDNFINRLLGVKIRLERELTNEVCRSKQLQETLDFHVIHLKDRDRRIRDLDCQHTHDIDLVNFHAGRNRVLENRLSHAQRSEREPIPENEYLATIQDLTNKLADAQEAREQTSKQYEKERDRSAEFHVKYQEKSRECDILKNQPSYSTDLLRGTSGYGHYSIPAASSTGGGRQGPDRGVPYPTI